jgi:hypothetical protein
VATLDGAIATLGARLSRSGTDSRPDCGSGLPLSSVETLRTTESLGIAVLLMVGGLVAALMLAAVSLAARGTEALPNWLVTAGFVVAVILLGSVMFIPMVVLLLWVLAVAITVGRSSAGRSLSH